MTLATREDIYEGAKLTWISSDGRHYTLTLSDVSRDVCRISGDSVLMGGESSLFTFDFIMKFCYRQEKFVTGLSQ